MRKTPRALVGALLLIALALVSSGCLWAFPRFDSGGTGNNTSENTLTMANVSGLHESWRTPALGTFRSEPLVSSTTVFVATLGASGSQLQAFDLAGTTGCSGSPKVCQPLWTAPLNHFGQPSIAGTKIFVSGAAYDLAGTTNCAGAPKVCQPLFTTSSSFISTVIVGDLVYATPTMTGTEVLSVYDATGTNGCAGSPKVCAPLRTYRATCNVGETCQANQPVADGDRVFVPIGVNNGTDFTGRVAAFDRNGVTGCAGTPTVCQTIWLRTIGAPWNIVAAGGRVWTAASTSNITNTPPTSFRLFALSAVDGTTVGSTPATTTASTVVSVGGGLVHLAKGQTVETYDATCTGTCPALRFYGAAGAAQFPIIANGLLYSGNQSALKVYDVTGVANCGGTPIPGCAPIANIALPIDLRLSAVQSGKVVFNGDNDERIRVFGL